MRALAFLIVSLLCVPASAVTTSHWTQTSEADFNTGTLDNVVATNLGDLKLSRAVKTLLEQDPRISIVNALAQAPDGSIYAGTGPNGVLLRIKDGAVQTAATLEDDTAISALLVQKDGSLLLGTSGEAGRVLKIVKAGDKPRVLFEKKGVQYVWALAQSPDGLLYAATGPDGQVYEIKRDGTSKVLLQTDANNVTCLIGDGKDLLYAGTDTHGLVYRVNRKTGESFVLYNAAESEISALVLDNQGNLYASTAEAREEPGGPAEEAGEAQKNGRPEGGAVGVPIPSDRPKAPSPAPPPNPNPGQPNPIPKKTIHHEDTKTRSGALLVQDVHAPLVFRAGWSDRVSVSSDIQNPSRLTGVSAVRTAQYQLQIATPEIPLTNQSKTLISVQSHSRPLGTLISTASSCLRAFVVTSPPVSLALADDPGDGPPGKKRRPKPGQPDPVPGPTPNPGPTPKPGKPQPPGRQQPGSAEQAPAPGRQPMVDTTEPIEPRSEGNAIYKIDPEGFVTEVFRQPVLILGMIENNGALLVATGGAEGQVYQVRPAADETLVLAKVDAKEIMCLLSAADGNVYMGTANVGSLASMSGGFASRGAFTSAVLDATQISRFGKIQLHGTLPPGTSLTLATRSGNVKEADEKSWSKWSDEAPAAEFVRVTSPSARFLQYRLSFASATGTATPVVEDVTVAYQIPNLPPRIKSIKLTAGPAVAEGAPENPDVPPEPPKRVQSGRFQTIAWEASDPNNDVLSYSLYFRLVGQREWILLKNKISESSYLWDTREVADGRYEVKVVASDAAANPPGMGKTASRVSDPITVDNTPPVIADLKSRQAGAAVNITLRAVDRTSTVAAVDYSVDSNKDWQFVLPTDQIYDSPEEKVAFSIRNLSPGHHQVTLRATDAKGNQSFENLLIDVQGPAARK